MAQGICPMIHFLPKSLQDSRSLSWQMNWEQTAIHFKIWLEDGNWEEWLGESSLFSSVQFSRSVISGSLRPHKSQHARPPCPSPTPRVYPNSCPSSRWCHPTVSSSVVPFSSCPQSLPASGSFQMSQFFAWGGQSYGVSASTSVPPVNTQDWSPLGWTGWISLQFKGLSRVFSNTTVKSINSSMLSFLHITAFSHIHIWKLEKP